jgi:hypothetical protein
MPDAGGSREPLLSKPFIRQLERHVTVPVAYVKLDIVP